MKIRVYDEKRRCWDNEPIMIYPGQEIRKQGRVIQFFSGSLDRYNQEIFEGDIVMACGVGFQVIRKGISFYSLNGEVEIPLSSVPNMIVTSNVFCL